MHLNTAEVENNFDLHSVATIWLHSIQVEVKIVCYQHETRAVNRMKGFLILSSVFIIPMKLTYSNNIPKNSSKYLINYNSLL
jgi:hypothetical protein